MDFYRPPALQGALDALGTTYRALQTWKFYPHNHPTRKSSIRQAHSAMLSMLDGNSFHLKCGRTGFSLPDGETLHGDSRMAAPLSYELFIRRVQKVTFLNDLHQEDLLALIRILALPPDVVQKEGGVDKIMAEWGVRTIWCNEFDLSIIRSKRTGVESSGALPQGVDELEDTTLENEFSHVQPVMILDQQDPARELQELLPRLDASTDEDSYLVLVRHAIVCSDMLKSRQEMEPLLPLAELLSDHADDISRTGGLRACARFGLEQLATGEEFLSFLFDRMGSRAGLPPQALHNLLSVAGPIVAGLTMEKMAQTDNLTMRKNLSMQLSRLGEPIVPAALKLMDDKRWFIVRNLCAVLGNIGAAAAIPELQKCLQHSDIRVCKEAVRSLAKISGRDAEEAIMGVLSGDDPALIPQAIASLGGMKSRKALVELMRIVCSHDLLLKTLPLKIEAVTSIGMIGDRQVVPILTELLDERRIIAGSRWEQLKIAIAGCLARLADDRALPVLKKKSHGSGELSRACAEAVEAIERTGGSQHGGA